MPAHPRFAEHEFRKATRSSPNRDCVQVARRDGWVVIRDDKTTFGADDDHRLLLSAAAFDAALAGWRRGERTGLPVEILDDGDGHRMRLAGDVGPTLCFTRREIDAFLHGAAQSEFDTPAEAPTAR